MGNGRMHTYLYVHILICSLEHMILCTYVDMLICSNFHMFTCSFLHIFICSYVYLFILLFLSAICYHLGCPNVSNQYAVCCSKVGTQAHLTAILAWHLNRSGWGAKPRSVSSLSSGAFGKIGRPDAFRYSSKYQCLSTYLCLYFINIMYFLGAVKAVIIQHMFMRFLVNQGQRYLHFLCKPC